MSKAKKSVCLIVSGLKTTNMRLQPWRYLTEVAVQLFKRDHIVNIVTDSFSSSDLSLEVPIYRLTSTHQFTWQKNRELSSILHVLDPQVVLWNVGVTSFIHQDLPLNDKRLHIGIFTAPLYTMTEMKNLGLPKLLRNWSFSAVHLIGAFSPRWMLREGVKRNPFRLIVTQTKTTAQRLAEKFWEGAIAVIHPGVDEIWDSSLNQLSSPRTALGLSTGEFLIGYFGALSPVRGIQTLICSIANLRGMHQQVRLVILARPSMEKGKAELRTTRRLISHLGLKEKTHLIEINLPPPELVRWVAACDLVALPFELVLSDAPLSLIEAQALGKPVVTTRISCLPELLNSRGYLAEPGSVVSLTCTLQRAIEETQIKNSQTFQSGSFAQVRSWQKLGEEWSELIETL